MYKVAMIGAGNVAWHLAPALEQCGHLVTTVYSRRLHHAEALCSRLYEARAVDSLDFSAVPADLFVLSVSDDALPQVIDRLILPEHPLTVVHTSGSRPLEILRVLEVPHGVFYPLQTFSKNKEVDWRRLPICVEGNTPQVEERLMQLARAVSGRVYQINSERRRYLHVAAVFACNFTNHMLALAEDLCEQYELDFEILHPLLAETFEKALRVGARQAQTGPAARGDVELIEQHLHLLSQDPDKQRIYRLLSESILNYQG
ncbi:putative short-subunit dehydrogenase-like oxidoreductase (DUF2520 family) [Thermonema lapsum]|uniref:Putative short-subunit dehydrogenase-like oxidoreductase (DUF2520 family) n=1 Tax=Thermonema lapsum TaxID=28195 RepID=A0A846MMG5_9BACT|nr:Rossmann-like and DUF2520 domain-containing protein [Thermonema lapsum]NIK72567.1 putative short-subunit dehydrogenase-like oxidoreductase (DUF2520 family) [Thermonema lapsum]